MFVGIYSILLSPHQLLDSGCIVHEVESVSRGLIVTKQHRIPPSPPRLRKKGKGTYIYWETSVSSTLTDALSIASTLVFTIRLIQISCYNKQPPNISGLTHSVHFSLTPGLMWVGWLYSKLCSGLIFFHLLSLPYCGFPVALASLNRQTGEERGTWKKHTLYYNII